MDIKIKPGRLSGTIKAIPSKSQAHRLLICAAFCRTDTFMTCPETNRDIEATADCLRALGAEITRSENGYAISPIRNCKSTAMLPCAESGSTLRFMLPIVGALGVDATFLMEGRLSQRPLSPLWEEMEAHGCNLSRPSSNTIRCQGQLKPGSYYIDGSISSQFITGLLFALSLLSGDSQIHITGKAESLPYIKMTQKAMALFGINTDNLLIQGGQPYQSPGCIIVEGDWSNGAFFLTGKALGNSISVDGLCVDSPQGDRAVAQILSKISNYQIISAADIPDLVPILSVAAAANKGCQFTDIQRLRLKESDRVASVISLLTALGIQAEATTETLTVHPGKFHGGIVDAVNDHRIAMTAAIAATIADGDVIILGAECVSKSYPSFWQEYARLGGSYEQYVR